MISMLMGLVVGRLVITSLVAPPLQLVGFHTERKPAANNDIPD